MPVRYGRFEMPKTLSKDEKGATETYAKFVAEPFEAGYGHTVGNSLRRVLLSSLEGAAITAVKITGAQHEFATLPGVVEDVTDIVLNLKRVKLKASNGHARKKLCLAVNKDGEITERENEEVIEFDETPAGVSEENMKLKKLLNMSVNEIELSVRAANCLNNANITSVGQLAQKTESEMLKYRNFGKKSLNEIKDKLQQLGLSLGMKFEAGLVEPVAGGPDGASDNGAAAESIERK